MTEIIIPGGLIIQGLAIQNLALLHVIETQEEARSRCTME
jgi:hypothetical protein